MSNIYLKAKADAAGKKVSLLAYSGGLMRVSGIGLCALDLSGLEIGDQTKILCDHDETIGGIAGYGKARLKDGKLYLDGTILETTENGKKIIELIDSGIELECSVGCETLQSRLVEDGQPVFINQQSVQSDELFVLVEKAKLREISIVPCGADGSTGLEIKSKADYLKGENVMNERERVSEILKLAEEHGQTKLAASAIRTGMTVDAFRAQLLNEIRASRNSCPPVSRIIAEDAMIDRNVLQAGFLLSCGHEQAAVRACGADATFKARKAGLTNIVDVARQAMILAGETHIPSGSRNILRASFSTASMANILSGSVDKLLADTAAQIKDPWRPFSKVRVLNNYRSHSVLRAEIDAALEETPPSGEVKAGALSEASFDSLQCKLFSKLIRVSLQMLMSDDLSVFADMPEALIRSAKKSLNDNVFGTLMANTGGAFYSAANGNYADGANTALSVNALGAAITLMRKMVDAQGMPMDIVPVALIVPSDLEQTAKQILNSSELARTSDNSPTGNPWNQSLILVSEPRLSNANFAGHSTTAWYLASANSMNVGFVGGEIPQVTTFGPDSEPGSIGYAWRVEYSYGSSMADPSSTIKMKGSA